MVRDEGGKKRFVAEGLRLVGFCSMRVTVTNALRGVHKIPFKYIWIVCGLTQERVIGLYDLW